jgi:hypothetical protein
LKIVINGVAHDYDGQRAPMSEALAIEDVYKRRYAEWQSDLAAGSARAMCVLAWIILRRDGTDIPFEDIISGKFDFDLVEMLTSMAESAEAEAPAEADPTVPSAPAGTPSTGTDTSSSSPANSTSARGKSSSLKSRTSRP